MSLNIDAYPVENEQEALVLMTHHLQLAAAYFEATPENKDEVIEYLVNHFNPMHITAVTQFFGVLDGTYETLDAMHESANEEEHA